MRGYTKTISEAPIFKIINYVPQIANAFLICFSRGSYTYIIRILYAENGLVEIGVQIGCVQIEKERAQC